ncbi:HEAT repeat domain-containing protein, partial [bacterium]|nr:HEAT repeat domain-containing protein [bacterium]
AEEKAPVGGPEISAHEREQQVAAQTKAMAQVEQLFEEENLNEIISLYVALPAGRPKQRIIQGLIDHIDDWGIEPVFAVAALETDGKMFRFAMRLLLRLDRTKICHMIEMESYSPDLQKVAVTVLAELGVRSSLTKLKESLEISDPIVRSVALNGIARAGRAALSYIPDLVQTAKGDPNPGVRLAAAGALESMNLIEAYQALDVQSHKSSLEPKVLEVLDRMRDKFGDSSEGFGKKRTPGKADDGKAGSGFLQKNSKNIVSAIILVAMLAAAGWYAHKIWREYNPVIVQQPW